MQIILLLLLDSDSEQRFKSSRDGILSLQNRGPPYGRQFRMAEAFAGPAAIKQKSWLYFKQFGIVEVVASRAAIEEFLLYWLI